MGGGESCPKCEQKECSAGSECEDCNARDYILDDDKKIQHVKGTPFFITTIEKTITDTYTYEDAMMYIIEGVIKDSEWLFALEAVDNKESPTKVLGVMLTTDLRSNQTIVYNRKNDYAQLKRLNEELNKIFKKYGSFTIFQIGFNYNRSSRDEIIISAVAGKTLTDQFDKYETIDRESTGDSKNYMKKTDEGREIPFINSDNTKMLGDLNIRITGVLGGNGGTYDYDTLLYKPAENKESFTPYSSGGCICIVLLIILAVFLLMFMLMRDPSQNRKAIEYDTEYKGEI